MSLELVLKTFIRTLATVNSSDLTSVRFTGHASSAYNKQGKHLSLSNIFVLDVRKLCFLSKQRCHSISVHNVFYDMFGFYEFNRLCSVYSVCGQSRGYFIASVWDVFRDLAF